MKKKKRNKLINHKSHTRIELFLKHYGIYINTINL